MATKIATVYVGENAYDLVRTIGHEGDLAEFQDQFGTVDIHDMSRGCRVYWVHRDRMKGWREAIQEARRYGVYVRDIVRMTAERAMR